MTGHDEDEPLLLHADPGDQVGEGVVHLLAGAATPPEEVASWCRFGRVYTLRAVLDPDPPVAAALVLSSPAAWVAELRSLVVTGEQRRRGLARRMLLGIADDLRCQGHQLLVTAVPSAHPDWLIPLEQVGFQSAGLSQSSVGPSPARDIRIGDALWLALVL